MLEIGTNLLTHTAEQTRKLNLVEAKVRTVPSCRPAAAAAAAAAFTALTPGLRPDAEPHVTGGDPAAGELSFHQQAGEGAAAADVRDQPAPGQEQVRPSAFSSWNLPL